MFDKLSSVEVRFEEVGNLLMQPETVMDNELYKIPNTLGAFRKRLLNTLFNIFK